MGKIVRQHWPLFIAMLVLLLAIGVPLVNSLQLTQGHLAYALDDPYIHMAIAKNSVLHRVWGVTKYEFSSSTSSILWTSLLAITYFIFGVNELAPFVLNLVFATMLIPLMYAVLRSYRLPLFAILAIIVVGIFLIPIPALVFTGMEHTLHMLLIVAFFFLSSRLLSGESGNIARDSRYLLMLAPLASLARYESLFLILIVSALFTLRKRWLYALLLTTLAIFPIAVYGVISVKYGWLLLPNSVLLKGSMPSIGSIQDIIAFISTRLGLFCDPKITYFFLLVILAAIKYSIWLEKERNVWDSKQVMLFLFVAASLIHTLFAGFGWFYRYEAYLVALGIISIGISISKYITSRSPENKTAGLMPAYLLITFY